jgi:hypothetical protein
MSGTEVLRRNHKTWGTWIGLVKGCLKVNDLSVRARAAAKFALNPQQLLASISEIDFSDVLYALFAVRPRELSGGADKASQLLLRSRNVIQCHISSHPRLISFLHRRLDFRKVRLYLTVTLSTSSSSRRLIERQRALVYTYSVLTRVPAAHEREAVYEIFLRLTPFERSG